jgi:hypothetical protein
VSGIDRQGIKGTTHCHIVTLHPSKASSRCDLPVVSIGGPGVNSPIASRSKLHSPCPRCGTGTKGCSVTADGMYLCRGEAVADEWVDLLRGTLDSAGFGHYRRKDDDTHKQNGTHRGPTPIFEGQPVSTATRTHSIDWRTRAEAYAKNLTEDLRQVLARGLGLPVESLDLIPLLGYNPADPGGVCFTIPEMDASGTVIGISRRYSKGKGPAAGTRKR